MACRRPHAVEPRSAIFDTRRGEGGSGKLLCIEPERNALRRITPLRQRSGYSLAGEMVAEAGLIVGHLPARFMKPYRHPAKAGI
jgi:hypothetical protein